jgi:hypothetical protein
LPHICVFERSPAGIDLDVAAFDPPEFLKSLPECVQVVLKFRVVLGMRHEYADAALPVSLLRTRRERPSSHRATE